MKLILATRNKAKTQEIAHILQDLPLEIFSCLDFPHVPPIIEDGETFRENAVKKAEGVSSYLRMPALADDSGLEIEALGGRPGVLSSRFAGSEGNDADNIWKVLDLMKDVPEHRRRARFRCVIALAQPGQATKTVEGECSGIIAFEPRGTSGFGYDPIFIFPECNKTFAELGEEVKNRISHRAKALTLAKTLLTETFGITEPRPAGSQKRIGAEDLCQHEQRGA